MMTRVVAIQPRLPVNSLVASCRFYGNVLGFRFVNEEPSEADGFVIVARDGHGLQLVSTRVLASSEKVTVWVQVADAAAEHERIRTQWPIEWGPEIYWYGSREFAVLDPDGHRIIFSSPTNEPPTCTTS